MNFITYDPNTGELKTAGYMDDIHIQAEIDAGKPILVAYNIMNLGEWRVNLETKQLEPIKQDNPQ